MLLLRISTEKDPHNYSNKQQHKLVGKITLQECQEWNFEK